MAKERRLIIIDEADLLPMQTLEMLRNVSELYSFPILMIGEDSRLESKIASRRRLSSRIRRRLEFGPITQADCLQFLRKALDAKVTPEVCAFIHRGCEGNWRPLLVRAAAIERALRASGLSEITMDLVKGVS
jgi:DNA transposition AAA+ family ATPase